MRRKVDKLAVKDKTPELVLCPTCQSKQVLIGRATYSGVKYFILECGHRPTAQELDTAEDILEATLRPFQKEGVKFAREANYRYLCADDMGLGKTPQALMCLRKDWDRLTPALIVVKSGLMHNWMAESLYWLGNPKLDAPKRGMKYQFEPNWARIPQLLSAKDTPIPGNSIYIASMDSLHKLGPKLDELGIKSVIVDESHHFKSLATQRTKALHKFILMNGIKHVICLSGTPIANNAREYYPTLKLLKPLEFNNERRFIKDWIDTYDGRPKGLKPWMKDTFFRRTADIIIRRRKEDVLKEQPALQRIAEIVDIDDPAFIKVYKQGQKNLQDFLLEAQRRDPKQTFELLALLAKLRKICGLAKVKHVAEKAEEFFESEEISPKLLIGVHHHSVGEALKERLKSFGAEYLIGGMSPEARLRMENKFRDDPNCKVLVASTLAAGEGLNFQFAHTAFQVERQWNMPKEIQFEARINRMGQKWPMSFYYFMVRGSIDEWLHNLVNQKYTWTESALSLEDNSEEPSVNMWDLADQCTKRLEV